jgi:hypothetical protein
MKIIKNHEVILNDQEKFRLKLIDAYEKMEPKNVRYLCRLFGRYFEAKPYYLWQREPFLRLPVSHNLDRLNLSGEYFSGNSGLNMNLAYYVPNKI